MKWAPTLLHRIDQAGWFPPQSRLLIAVSGGCDSVALLHVLRAGAAKRGWCLGMAHLDHGLRGAESRNDARFVRRLGKHLGVPVHVKCVDVAEWADRNSVSIEVAARQCRYQWFETLCKRHRYSHVVLAHTRDDQAETVLLRLLRGSGLEGLTAMSPVSERSGMTLVRPFLEVPKHELVAYLQSRKLEWREDKTNEESVYARNRVRHGLLPVLKEFNPDIVGTLARTVELLREDRDIIEEIVQQDLATCVVTTDVGEKLDLQPWRELSKPRQRRVLHRWLLSVGDASQITSDAVDRLYHVCQSGRGTANVTLPGGGVVVRQYSQLSFCGSSPAHRHPLSESRLRAGINMLPEWGLQVAVTTTQGFKRQREAGIGTWPTEAYLAKESIDEGSMVIRPWRAGDVFSPHGSGGQKKVQDIFTDAKIPRDERGQIPLLVCRDEILWIPGYRIAKQAAVATPNAKSWHIRMERTGECAELF